MKWSTFKAAVESKGVEDSTEIDWISFHHPNEGVVVSASYGAKVKIQDDEFFAVKQMGLDLQ